MGFNNRSKKLRSVLASGLLITSIIVQVFAAETNSIINDTNLEQPSKGETAAKEPTVIVSSQPAENIVINSIDDGLLSAEKSSSERHHYEQQPEHVADSKPNPMAHIDDIDLYHGPIKPEPRNHQDEHHQDPAIIDHRPSSEQHQQHQNPPQQPQVIVQEVYATTTQAPQVQQQPQGNSVQTFILSQPAPLSQQQPQQVSVGTSTNWYPQQAPHTVTTYTQQQPSQQSAQLQPHGSTGGHQYTIVAQASNQVPTIVQHPTSINSIINEHHQQQQQMSPSVQTNQLPVSSGLSQAQLASAANNQQMVSVNGQPMILMNPNAVTNNGRRVSISGWLKGISSMLANIFNRREHGAQIMGQSSSPIGHWVQLGSNAPHWLSTAQTVAQQAQYHTQQQQFNSQNQLAPQLLSSGNNRYTTYIQTPTVQQAPQQPTLTLTTTTNNQQYQQNSDLQASGSSAQYVTVPPPSAAQQNQQQPTLVTIGQYAPSATSNANQVTSTVNQQQQSSTSHPNGKQVTGSQPTTQIRFGRSSSTDTSGSSSGLPLAHYSRYALSSD